MNIFRHPTAYVSRGIDCLIVQGESSNSYLVQGLTFLASRVLSITILPLTIVIQLIFKRIVKAIICPILAEKGRKIEVFHHQLDKVTKYALGLLFIPCGVISPGLVPGMFLRKTSSANKIRPFGVAKQFGKEVESIKLPQNREELQKIIQEAAKEKKQVSIIGAGMCQGPQTVPANDEHHVVINTKNLKQIRYNETEQTVTVEAGATWEQVQETVNQHGKSVIVKQASDVFSIGGSIGINCHGWAHEKGAISSTVKSLTVIDATGEIRKLTPEDELFGCFFGTLGYFGVILEAEFELVDNVEMVEETIVVNPENFIKTYKEEVKGKGIPLFGGRLTLDAVEGPPLREVHMEMFKVDPNAPKRDKPLVSERFKAEPPRGTRLERMALQALGHLSNFSARRVISYLWKGEATAMQSGRKLTRNEVLHPPIKSFFLLHETNLHAQWLQEYFIKEENLPAFLHFLGKTLQDNHVRVINSTIRPTPKDDISVLPYAEQDRYAVVISFDQWKTNGAIERTRQWMAEVNKYVIENGDKYYQAYMPFATQEEFVKCYGEETVERLRALKQKYDPNHIFGNGHTAKYFDKQNQGRTT